MRLKAIDRGLQLPDGPALPLSRLEKLPLLIAIKRQHSDDVTQGEGRRRKETGVAST
jgi:hypothetical protein